MEELLPVGSVISLKDKRVLMIIGYSPNVPLSEKQYDYVGSSISGIYKPQEDLRYNRDYYYFNKSEIISVLFIGYSDKEFDLYRVVNEKITSELSKAKKEKKILNEEDIKHLYEKSISEIKALGSDKNEKWDFAYWKHYHSK